MESFETAGLAKGLALRFTPGHDGKLVMTALDGPPTDDASVILDPSWLRPLAAWFAGEAAPVAIGEDSLYPYVRRLEVHGDEMALVWSTDTEAWLRCSGPYGTARVVIGPRGRMVSSSAVVLLSPEARREAAGYLRRVDAEHWTKSAA